MRESQTNNSSQNIRLNALSSYLLILWNEAMDQNFMSLRDVECIVKINLNLNFFFYILSEVSVLCTRIVLYRRRLKAKWTEEEINSCLPTTNNLILAMYHGVHYRMIAQDHLIHQILIILIHMCLVDTRHQIHLERANTSNNQKLVGQILYFVYVILNVFS